LKYKLYNYETDQSTFQFYTSGTYSSLELVDQEGIYGRKITVLQNGDVYLDTIVFGVDTTRDVVKSAVGKFIADVLIDDFVAIESVDFISPSLNTSVTFASFSSSGGTLESYRGQCSPVSITCPKQEGTIFKI
jgi:hypothetical protein